MADMQSKLMTKDEVVIRRFEAIRMKWAVRKTFLNGQECRIRWPGYWVRMNVDG